MGIAPTVKLDTQLLELPKEVRFCSRCVVSNQRPRIVFNDSGVCNACLYAEEKNQSIDWQQREAKLVEVLDQYRSKDGWFDVVVPCSGGKDASYVAHQLKYRYGMHPLTITWAPLRYTDVGFKNLQGFIHSGFNNILGTPNGRLTRKLARVAFEDVGDPFLPFIYGQQFFAFHLALKFDIKLIFFGENPEAEYGGDTKNKDKSSIPLSEFIRTYLKGCSIDVLIERALDTKDYFSHNDYEESDLVFSRPPDKKQIEKSNIQMHWYSYYHKWIPQENYYYCVEHTNFQPNPERSEGTYSKYASLDDRMDGFHYYLGYIKFGLGRATSDAAHEVRDGHLTREEAVALVKRYDGEFPGKHFKEFLEYTDMTEEQFYTVVDSFRLPHLWIKENRTWRLKHQVS